MRIIKGNKELEISSSEFADILKQFNKCHLDIGTGDGRYVYKNAIANPNDLYIGLDPSKKQLEIYSKKATRDKLENTLFVLASIELFPHELSGCCDNVTIFLPWGSLLKSVATVSTIEMTYVFESLKPEGKLEILFGYHEDHEPTEIDRLDLTTLNIDFIKSSIIPKFMDIGFSEATVSQLSQEDLINIQTSWSKKLHFGNDRPMFHLKLKKKSASA